MATIYPEHQRYHEPESEAERRMYPLLAELPDEFTVFCNRRWHVRSRSGRAPKPAEADFLVAHPDRGVLVLEVKGGVIHRDPSTERWYSNDVLLDPDPFKQVQRTHYLLAQMLEERGAFGIGIPLGEALVFPDGLVAPSRVPAVLLPERIIGSEDLDDLDEALDRCFDAFALRETASRFGRRGVRALTEAVAGSVHIRRHIGHQVRDAEQEMLELTQSQYAVLEQLDGNARVCVLGGAGTGKTLLAMEQARRLAGQGHRVLLTCFNAPLGAHIRSELGRVDGVEVLHFHLLCRAWANDGGLDTQQGEDESNHDFWDVRLPNLLTEAAAELDKRYDAILVDEAQDFLPDWLAGLQLLLADEDEGLMFLFADENQAIYQRAFEVPKGFMRFTLKDNLRNAAPIHELLSKHFGETSRAKGPDGVDIQVRCHGDTMDFRHELSSLLSHLTAHGVTTDQVTVLSGRSTSNSVLAKHAKDPLGKFRLTSRPSRTNDVRFESVHRFKGLEAPIVVLCEMADVRPEARRKLWYTGLSRARVGLFVLARGEPGDDLDDVISEAMAESAV